jgi:hypothetical protein
MTMIYRCVCYPRSTQWDSLNLDLDDRNILFHLSIRPDRQRIVVNEMVEGRWGEERIIAFDPGAAEFLPLTIIRTAAHTHLLANGEVAASIDTARAGDRPVTVRAAMPWTLSAAFGPFAAAAPCAWLPPEGIGATALHGFLSLPDWHGGPVSLGIGTARFAAQAMPARSADGLPQGFVVPLDPAAREALAGARAQHRMPTAVTVDLEATVTARGWVNPSGVVETWQDGIVTGWLRSRGAPPRLEMLIDDTPMAPRISLGGEPRFPSHSRMAARREQAREGVGDGSATERLTTFRIELPPAALAAGQRAELRLLGEGTELVGGVLAIGDSRSGRAALPTPAALEPEVAALDPATLAATPQGSAVEVLRLDVPPASAQDVWLDLVAPDGDVALHLRYRASENWLVTNRCSNGVWGAETVLGRLPSSWFRLVVDAELSAGRCVIAVNHVPWGEVRDERFGRDGLTVQGPHHAFARAAPRAAVPTPGPAAIGAVDHIAADTVFGWAVGAPPEAPLMLDLGAAPVALTPRWVALPALAARLGHGDALIGFEAALPPALRGRVGRQAGAARLSLDGQALSMPMPWTSAVAEVDGFVLRGDIIGPAAPEIAVRLGGRTLDLRVVCWDEPPLPALRAVTGSQPRRGFEIELPGTIWCGLGPEEAASIVVVVDGRVIEPGRLLITRAMARQALIRAAQAGDATPEAQAARLLAIEHMAFGQFRPALPVEAAGELAGFAHRMGLDGLLAQHAAPEAGPPRPPPAAPAVSAPEQQRIAVWRALRAVSQRLGPAGGPVFPHAKAVAAAAPLDAEALRHFWFALVPPLAATDELPLLAEALPLATWFDHEQRPDAWALSAAIALLAAGGEARRATEALYRLAGNAEGWINTDCIGFALRQAERAATAGALPEEEAERFRYAFLALLDGFNGQFFSRLHDRHLVEGMLLLLGRRHLMPDHLASDLVAAALRHYGLAPAFWQRWSAGPGRAEPADSLLAQAHRRFRRIASALTAPATLDARLATLHEALRFFRSHRNPESLAWMREVAAHALRPGSTAAAAPLARLLANLAGSEPGDAIRIAAMPGNPAPGGLDNLGVSPAGLRDMLRALRPQPRGLGEAAQRMLCGLLAAPAGAACGPAERERMRDLAGMLAAGRYGHVGADMLTLLATREAGGSAASHALIETFGTALLAALEAAAVPHPPAPFLAGLARLARLPAAAAPPQLPAVLRVLHGAIGARYRRRHEEFTTPPGSTPLPIDPLAIAGDVLVCVYSCNRYLDSRVAAIRATWMRDLAALGARCIVIVGDGDDRLDGDVLRLAVSDAYEDLPLKTLGMLAWVHANSEAQYFIKIDDDCCLSAANYFGTLEYRAHHYHGRLLERAVGGTDRAWHHAKSSSLRARSIDRSPEPSRYCDGGGVYSLSRFAMGRLLAAAQRRDGQRLVARSFMEDKLVGDLLALEDILPANTDYESYQRRRSHATAQPVGIYENTFFPSALAPAKVVHLDLDRDQARAHALLGQPVLSPKKLWPSFASVGTDHTAHQLELLSNGDALARAQAAPLGVVLAARNEMTMLPHLFEHYRGLGVRAFYAIDNLSDDGSREWLLAQPDAVVYSAASEYRSSHYGVTWQQTVLGHHFIGRWAVVADADEFLIYPGWRHRGVAALIAAVEAEGADAVPLAMVDMYPFGSLEEADFASRPPFEAAPWMDRDAVQPYRLTACFFSNRVQQVSGLRHRLMPDGEPNGFVAEKVALFRYQPWLRIGEGLHSAANVRLSGQRAAFAHFKYHAGFRRKVIEEIARGQHFNGAAEYRRYAAMAAEGFGGFGQAGLSMRLGADGFPAEPD